jgi:hypothetical protein
MLCASLEELMDSVELAAYARTLHSYTRTPREKTFNMSLIEEIKDLLAAKDARQAETIEELTLEEHAIEVAGSIDLLDYAYAPEPFLRNLFSGTLSYYRAVNSISYFYFLCRQPQPLLLSITYRAGAIDARHCGTLRLNGIDICGLPESPSWKALDVTIEATMARSGINCLSIEWPRPYWDRERWIRATADLFEAGIAPEISPIFGEIHSFTTTMTPGTSDSGHCADPAIALIA